jgi:hypothetical protein
MTSWSEKPVDLSSHIKNNKCAIKTIHPIFVECSKLTKDPLWIDIMEKCSRAKFPKGFMVANGQIKFRKGNKVTQITIPKSPDEAFIAVKNFISTHGSIFSVKDKSIQDDFIKSSSVAVVKNDIKFIRKDKNLFDTYLEKYIRSKPNSDSLRYIINYGFSLSFLKTADVIFDGTEIVDIKNVIFDTDWKIDQKRIDSVQNKKPPKKIVKTPEDEFWNKYLRRITKGCVPEDMDQ